MSCVDDQPVTINPTLVCPEFWEPPVCLLGPYEKTMMPMTSVKPLEGRVRTPRWGGVLSRDAWLTHEDIVEKIQRDDPAFKVVKYTSQSITLEQVKTVLEHLEKNTHVDTLFLIRMGIDDAIMATLCMKLLKNTSIKRLSLSLNTFTVIGMMDLCGILLEGNPRIQSLILTGNNVNGEMLKTLSSTLLQPRCAITHLTLAQNKIVDRDVPVICSIIKHNRSLVYLHLGENKITAGSLPLLLIALTHNETLKEIALNEIPTIHHFIDALSLKRPDLKIIVDKFTKNPLNGIL